MNRIVVSPELRRPPVRGFGSTSGLCGCFVVMSSLTSVVRYRNVCVVGLYVLIGIISSSLDLRWIFVVIPEAQHLQPDAVLQILRVLRHLLAAAQPHVRLLPIRTVSRKLAAAPLFSWIRRCAHRMHFHFENR